MTDHADWPALPYEEWAPTKKTLHMVAQMLGKTKLEPATSGDAPGATSGRREW